MTRGSAFLAALLLGWVMLAMVSFVAIRDMGVNAAGAVFIGDFAHPWRAQFNADFAIHLLLVAAWMIYRAPRWRLGLLAALLAILLGGVFTLAYLIVASIDARGDMQRLLLGRHAAASTSRDTC